MPLEINPCSIISILFFGLSALLWTSSTVIASNECAPVTWLAGTSRHRPDPERVRVLIRLASTLSPSCRAGMPSDYPFKPGDINCRYERDTGDDVNYYTCTELAKTFGTRLDLFFILNPGLKPDCSNIQPNTEYCVRGCKSFELNRRQHLPSERLTATRSYRARESLGPPLWTTKQRCHLCGYRGPVLQCRDMDMRRHGVSRSRMPTTRQ